MVNRRQLRSRHWEFKGILESLFTNQIDHLSLSPANTQFCSPRTPRWVLVKGSTGAVGCSGACSPLPAARGKGVTNRHFHSL